MDQWQLQQAVAFLVEKVNDVDVDKPIIIHGIRVGEILYRTGADDDVVIAGYLHDLIEDTEVNYEMIEENFGVLVASIVESNTLKEVARGNLEEKRKYFSGIATDGQGAVLVKAADLADNLQHYRVYHDEQRWEENRLGLLEKKRLFLEECEVYKDLPLYKVIEHHSFEDQDALWEKNNKKIYE